MNPMTNVKNITKLNETELAKGTTDKKSWHDIYKESAWIFIGGLPYGLTEGDVLAVFSQYGEIVNLNLVRDKKTGKTKGFCFLCYANQKSTVLAVDNFNGIKLLNRTIRVDHVANYKPPKDNEHDDEVTKQLKSEGCAPKLIRPETPPVLEASSSKKKKSKKEKKKHKKDKKEAGDKSLHGKTKIKKEKHDPGYDKYELPQNNSQQSKKSKKRRAHDSESSTSEESSDESFANDKTQSKEKGYERNIDKSRSRTLANDFTEHNRGGSDKYSSTRKRNLRESESDSDDSYLKKKKSKASHNKDENRLSSDVHYNKHKPQHLHKSSSSECSSPNEDERRNVRKPVSYEQHKTSYSDSSKSIYMSENRRKDTAHQRYDSSSSEEVHQSHSRSRDNNSKSQDSQSRDSNSKSQDSLARNRSRERETTNYSRYEISQYKDYNRKDDRSDRAYNADRSSAHDRGDRRYTDTGGHNRNSDQGGSWRKGAERSHKNYDEQSHPRKYSDQKDRKSYDYKNDGENSNRDSSKYSRSVQNTRSSSTERKDKHYSKHKEDSYDRKKR